MNHPKTQRMVSCPVNRAIVDHVRTCGRVTRQAIAEHLLSIGLHPGRQQVYNLCAIGVLTNVAPHMRFAEFALGRRAALFDAPAPYRPPVAQAKRQRAPQAAPAPAPVLAAPAPWVGTRVPPRQYDVMRAPVWVPPDRTPTRPGAGAFLNCPTRGHRC